VPVKSRVLVGVGAWLVGAVAATSGSMIAVDQLAHGLLGQQTQQLTEANLSVNPDAEADGASPAATASQAADPSSRRSAAKHAKHAAARPSPSQSLTGTLLQSPDGSVMAVCQAGGAYLLYWSPDQGFEADDVNRGPAAVTRVIFRGRAGSVGVRVSCAGGSPVAHLFHPAPDDSSDDGPHDT
jgi:hypothetical protein